mgnify:CR=1 FL=1
MIAVMKQDLLKSKAMRVSTLSIMDWACFMHRPMRYRGMGLGGFDQQ